MLSVKVLRLSRLIATESYLCNHISCFSEILAAADVGACQKVFDQAHSDVVTPERGNKKEERIIAENVSHEEVIFGEIFGI